MVKIIVGLMGSTASALSSELSTPEQLKGLLSVLKQHNIHELDTARLYQGGKSEELLGQVGTEALASGPFTIATKAPAFMPGTLTYDKIVNNCNASLEALKAPSVDLYYLHGPDRETPLEESCRAIQDLFKQGKFTRWGLSNLHVDEVNEIVDICTRNGWEKPSVYQGGYNPIMRSMEKNLLPSLRKHGMTFYAYSPVAGGYFTKPVEQLRAPPADSRMEKMKIFHSMYVNDVSLQLREKLDKVCEAEGVSVMDATFRWMMHHSALGEEDGIVLGGGSTAQFEENLKACEQGPLSKALIDAFEDLWREYVAAGKALTYCLPRNDSERLHS